MRAHRLRLGLHTDRLPRVAARFPRCWAALASAVALTGGTALVLLPAAASAEECPNAAFRTGPSAHLPDCRAYEMVTPPFKDMGYARVGAISPSGLSTQLYVNGAFAGVEGFPNLVFPIPGEIYTTRRTAAGWVSSPDDPPITEYLPYPVSGVWNYGGAAEEGPDNQVTEWVDRGAWQPDNRLDFFTRRSDRSIVDIGPALPPTAPQASPDLLGSQADLVPLGSSANASRHFFSIRKYYWPFDDTVENHVIHEKGYPSLYEYLGTGNTTPLLVGVDDSGKQISQCGTALGGEIEGSNGDSSPGHNAVSSDGNTVFFTAPAFPREECEGSRPPVGELYARIDNGLPGAHTVAISEPSKEDCSACDTEAGVRADAHFQGASEDGSKVFFTTTQPLLGSDTSENLYQYDFDAPVGERVVRATAGDATVSNPAPGLVESSGSLAGETPMSSEDGSHVYFIAFGVLTTVPNGEGESAEAGAFNLYVFERDARFPGGHSAFVARLSAESWAPDMTPDGRFLVFASGRDLTPDDTSTARQLFEYDAQTGALVRLSIGQDGFNHNGNVPARYSKVGEEIDRASIVSPGRLFGLYQPTSYWTHLSVSSDGSYVFFQSTVGLTPQALDQKVVATDAEGDPVYAMNIYEYHAGRVSLISDGQDVTSVGRESNVELLGTDASGGDVFFQTVDRLVGQDTDTNLDMYDARIDGGFPAPALPSSCSGDTCQGPLGGAPALLSPGSEFQAGGNPPLAAAPAVKAKPKQKAKRQKAQKQRPKGGKTGRGRAERRGRKAKRAAVGGRANRKAGRS